MVWQRQMAHVDWLICGLEKFILPSQEIYLALSTLKKFILPARGNFVQI